MPTPPVVVLRPRRFNFLPYDYTNNLEAKAREAGFDNIQDYRDYLHRSDPITCKLLSSNFLKNCLSKDSGDSGSCDFLERALVFGCAGEKEATTEANMRKKATEVALKFDKVRCDVDGFWTKHPYWFNSQCLYLRKSLLSKYNVEV